MVWSDRSLIGKIQIEVDCGKKYLICGMDDEGEKTSDDPSYVTGGEPKYPQELFSAVDLFYLSSFGCNDHFVASSTLYSATSLWAAVKSQSSYPMASKDMAGVRMLTSVRVYGMIHEDGDNDAISGNDEQESDKLET
ncbi:hypothetical protein Tco_0672228 [Tanacetum coccineum]